MRRRVVDLLWNRRTRRPRLPVRIAAVFVAMALLGLTFSFLAPFLRGSVVAVAGLVTAGTVAAVVARNVVLAASLVVVYVGAVYLAGRFVDRRRFRDFGLHVDREWWLDLGFGLVLGAALMSGVFLVEFAAGWVVVTGTFRVAGAGVSFPPWFASSAATFVAVGVGEELLSRGYLIKNLSEGLTWFNRIDAAGAVALSVLGSSLVFAWGHLANPNASLASAAGILVAGVMLAAGYLLTGELAIPIGIHVTWNFFQGPVYGFPVSGVDFGASLLAIEQRGPPVLAGGTFGPEAGLLGVVASAAGIGLIVAWVWWREGDVRIAPSITSPDLRTGADAGTQDR